MKDVKSNEQLDPQAAAEVREWDEGTPYSPWNRIKPSEYLKNS